MIFSPDINLSTYTRHAIIEKSKREKKLISIWKWSQVKWERNIPLAISSSHQSHFQSLDTSRIGWLCTILISTSKLFFPWKSINLLAYPFLSFLWPEGYSYGTLTHFLMCKWITNKRTMSHVNFLSRMKSYCFFQL